jgi:O-antigen/teichoic acid export membrane protein
MKKSSILKETGTLLGGNVLAQVIALAAYFILMRIFSPDDYGLYNIFYSYIEVLIILSTLKYELAVVVADDDREANDLAGLTLRINTLVSLLLLTIVLVLWLTGMLPGNFAQLGWMVLLIPPMVFFCGTSRVYGALFNRMHRYRSIAVNETVNAGTGALLKIALGLLGMLQAGMPVGTVAGRAIANITYRLKLRQLGRTPSFHGDRTAAFSVMRKHRNFPFFVASKDFINSLSYNLPFLWLALYFDRAEVGLFALALTFTFRPANLLNTAIEKVYYARTAEGVRQGEPVGRMISRMLLVVNAIALPVCILAWFAAEPVFSFCFGGRWAGCGVYVRALLPWIFLSLSATPLTFISNVFSTQRIEFYFYLVLLALRVAAIAIGVSAGGFLLAIRLYAAAGALISASLLMWYLWQVRRYERSLPHA